MSSKNVMFSLLAAVYVGGVVCTRNTIVDCLYLGYVDSVTYKYILLASVHVGDVATPK